ncbi:MAG TPA: NADH-quinone oxidoreductase subunit N [Gemmataceae bacterium]|nr:NADH-quinone oxidoreductase subunit N [Gemmataceae bacterium]
MFLHPKIIEQFQSQVLANCRDFLPELILCGAIVLMLLLRLFNAFNRWHLGWVALILTLAALGVSGGQWFESHSLTGTPLFGGLLVYDQFTIFLRLFVLGFTALVIWLTLLTGIPDREDSADFYSLLLGAAVGMMLMASSNNLLMVFIAVEMASLPSYALAGFLKGRRQSSEASLKYVVYGGGASGIMLYGISLLAGKFGTAYLPELAAGYVAALKLAAATPLGLDPVLLLGTLFILIGIGFKLAAVPFHFWCPDVFEGAAAEVAAFLSVASKGAALALLARFGMVLAGLERAVPSQYLQGDEWMNLVRYLAPALAFFAALTATFGNLAAYLQTNLKRLLAYSTIAQAGYMMMGLAPLTQEGVSAVLFYLIAYLFMNLGAFAVVAFLRNQTGSEDLSSFRGLVRRSPLMVATLGVFLLSLLGIPPLVGFMAKFQIFRVLFDAGRDYTAQGQPALGATMYALLVIAGLNTVVSAVYYIKVLKVMSLDMDLEELEGRPAKPLPMPTGPAVYATVMAVLILVLGILWNPLARFSAEAVGRFRPSAPSVPVAPAAAAATPKMLGD